ncbi:hypothetical protein, partial [Bacteroides ovatus]|uniref:hypothetical protein n=1 Tax=Bacteroides ovatus TaxID=28116 RepID=UPI0039B45091
MKVLKYIFSMMLLGGIISACADLDTKLTNEWSESDTWRDADMAQGVLLSVYQDVIIPGQCIICSSIQKIAVPSIGRNH